MNLEALALRRAEEQMDGESWRYSGPVRFPNDLGPSVKGLTCICGRCKRCKNRIGMRNRRRYAVKPPPKPRGPSMAMGRVCSHVYRDGRKCSTPIADWNTTGACQRHHSLAWDRANRDRSAP